MVVIKYFCIFIFYVILFSCHGIEHDLSCQNGTFLCGNGRCIEDAKVCDGFLDCNDVEASDESLKICNGEKRQKCAGIKIYCPNTNICLWPFELCDGTNNCGDFADESLDFCATHKCSPHQVQCPNGRCIPEEWFCNGKILCQNETWEKENIKCTDENGKKACFGQNAFKCDNGKCLSRLGLCDGVDQCGDGSDEASDRNCGNRTCLSHEFYCYSNKHRSQFAYECIPKTFTCDGSADCPEGEDEHFELCGKSQNVSCTKYEFQCNSKQCVPADSECNGIADCFDASDEHPNCTIHSNNDNSNNNKTTQIPVIGCPEGYLLCGNSRCISEAKVCDGAFDCNDKDVSDENDKTCSKQPIKCTGDMFKCPKTNICIWPWDLCDGINNCADFSDENTAYCKSVKIPDTYVRCPSGRSFPESWFCNGKILCEQPWENENIKCKDESGNKKCFGKSTFQCDNGMCIPRFELCDGKDTCGDASDESSKQNCGHRTCLDHEFHCYSNLNSSKPKFECIPKSWTCDKAVHCPEGEDESAELCGQIQDVTCNKREFTCNNSQCILGIGECNGIKECMDGSDEHSKCPPRITIYTEYDGVNLYEQHFLPDDPEFIEFQKDAKVIQKTSIIYAIQYFLTAIVLIYILWRLFFNYRSSVYMPFLTAIMLLGLIMTLGSFAYFALTIFPISFGQPCRFQKFVNGLEGFSVQWLWAAMYFQRYISIFHPLVRMKQDGIWRVLNSTKLLIAIPVVIGFIIAAWAALEFTVHDRHIGDVVQTWCRRDSIIISAKAQQVISITVDCWKFVIPFAIILYLDFAVVFRQTKSSMFAADANAHSARIESKERTEATQKRRQQNIKTCLIIVTIEALLNLPLRLHSILYVHFQLYVISYEMSMALAIIFNTMYTIQIAFKAIATHLLCRSYRPKAKASTTTPRTYSTSVPSSRE